MPIVLRKKIAAGRLATIKIGREKRTEMLEQAIGVPSPQSAMGPRPAPPTVDAAIADVITRPHLPHEKKPWVRDHRKKHLPYDYLKEPLIRDHRKRGQPRERLKVPISPRAEVDDTLLFEAPKEMDKKYYVPRYHLAETEAGGDQRYRAIMEKSDERWRLVLHLTKTRPTETGSTAAEELPHTLRVILRYRTPDGVQRELAFDEITEEEEGYRAGLSLNTLAVRDAVYHALTELDLRTELLVHRAANIAVPSQKRDDGTQLYRVKQHTFEGRSEPQPFVFDPEVHGYIFADVRDVSDVALRFQRYSVRWQDRPYSYYQDPVQPHIFLYFPDSFKVFRESETHEPSLRVAFASEDGSLDEMRVTLEYAAVPVVRVDRLEAASKTLKDQIGDDHEPVFESFAAGADQIRFLLHLPGDAGGRREITNVVTDIRSGFSHILSDLSLDAFQAIFDAMFGASTALFTGDILVNVQEEETEQIPFTARFDDLVGEVFEIEEERDFEVGQTPKAVSLDWYTFFMSGHFSDSPVALAALQTAENESPAGIRMRNLAATSLEIKIEEEESKLEEAEAAEEVAEAEEAVAVEEVVAAEEAAEAEEVAQLEEVATEASTETLNEMEGTSFGEATETLSQGDEDVPDAVQRVRERLADEVNVTTDDLRIVSIESKQWGDTSLGCPEPGMDYPQVVVPGYQVFVRAGNVEYDVRTNENGRSLVICDSRELRNPEAVGCLIVPPGEIVDADGDRIGEAGRVTADQPDGSTWHTVTLEHEYDDPVILMQITTFNGPHPSHTRLREVTGNSFDYQIEEWDYLDQRHTSETIAYAVLEKGIHQLPAGATIEVGAVDVDHRWTRVALQGEFSTTPTILSHCQSYNGKQAVVTRQRDTTTSAFDVRLQEERGNDDRHKVETIGYVATTFSMSATLRNAIESPVVVQEFPAVLFADGTEFDAHVERLTQDGTEVELPVELAPDDEVHFTLSTEDPVTASQTPEALFELDEVEVNIDREALWDVILDPSVPAEYTRTIQVVGFEEMFAPHTDIQLIVLDFPRGESALIKADQLEDEVTIRIPLRDHILEGVVQGEYRYTMRVVRSDGQETTEHTASTGILTPDVG